MPMTISSQWFRQSCRLFVDVMGVDCTTRLWCEGDENLA